MELKYHNLLLTSPNFHIGEVEKEMFQVLDRHWEPIIFPLTS